MTSTLITAYLGQGLAAARPVTPAIAAGSIGFYYATDTDVLTVYANGAWRSPGGYASGTIPTVKQVAFSPNHSAGATFGIAPTNGNLLVAMTFNPTVNTAGAGWTKYFENSSGTDFGCIMTKVAGGAESTTQSPLNAAPAAGGMVIWEIASTLGTPTVGPPGGQAEQSGSVSVPVTLPNASGYLGLSAIAVVTTPTITSVANGGTQDVLDNTGERKLFAGHTNLGLTPTVGVIALFSTVASSKALTILIKA
jgi:hypothetical protein